MTLPEKLLTLRKRSGLFQEALTEKLEVPRQTVSRRELGTAQPEVESCCPSAASSASGRRACWTTRATWPR